MNPFSHLPICIAVRDDDGRGARLPTDRLPPWVPRTISADMMPDEVHRLAQVFGAAIAFDWRGRVWVYAERKAD